MRSTANPIVFTRLELILQRLLDSVQHGYTHVVNGEVSAHRALSLATKFDIQYQVFADKNLRARRKRNGLGNAKWLCLSRRDKVYWWLLVNAPDLGAHFAHTSEKLIDVEKSLNALRFEGYELVQLPHLKPTKCKPANFKERSNQTRLTWRLSAGAYESFRCRIIEDVRSGCPSRLISLIRELYSLPGFGGVRSQVGKLVALYCAEVKRAGIKNAPKPLEVLRYVRRLRDDGIRLSLLAQAHQQKLDEAKNHV